jgi:DNA uptake protein ComE-like DNA-binding protein
MGRVVSGLFLCSMSSRRIKHLLLSYFTCTRTEKHAAIVLAGLLLVIQGYLFIRHHLIQPQVIPLSEAEKKAVATLQDHSADVAVKVRGRRQDRADIEMRPFDPNLVDENGFVQLGMSPRQAASLIRYRDKIGGFRSKEDVKRVRVLDTSLYAHWAPFIELPERSQTGPKVDRASGPSFPSSASDKPPKFAARMLVLDINDADTILLKELPWIGSGRARAIVNYRDRLGGFIAFEQLREVKAIPDSVFNHILPHLILKSPPYRKLEVNRLPVDSLRHPYLGKQFARMIVAYREQHGSYRSVNDLMSLPLADEEILRKLAPYLTF